MGAALAFFLGNPLFNPAAIALIGFILGWQFAVLRVVAGILTVFGVASLVDRFMPEDRAQDFTPPLEVQSAEEGSIWIRWLRTLWSITLNVVPAFVLSVFVLGAVRGWLFPAISPELGNHVLLMLGLAVVGALFIIPSFAEVPIIKTMMSFGLGVGPAAALLITLPAISLSSLIMVRKEFPIKVLWLVMGLVVLIGILTGAAAMAFTA
jgi:uncharacterized membrane protein YraQ (UPF0718 family)